MEIKGKKMNQPLILAIDFDDTISFRTDDLKPRKFLPFAKEVINWAYDKGCQILIWTCRDGEKLIEMKKFLDINGVKYHKINENADQVTFTKSRKIYYDILVDDKNYGAEIDWLKIKEKIKELMIKKLVDEIMKTASGTSDMPLMSRGKPVDESSGVGMDESGQKMFDGVDRSKKRYDQLKIVKKKTDWIDHEQLLNDIIDVRGPQNVIGSADTYQYTTNELDYYYNNPKGTGERVPDAIFAVEDVVKEQLIGEPEEIKETETGYRRDETQKYLTFDQPLHNKRYWQEKIEPMKHSV